MIQAKNLTKSYGSFTAVEDLTFTVERGETVGFLGPNGAGKTTTMRLLTGYFSPTAGTAQVAGFDVGKEPVEVKSRVGYLPETPPLYEEMTVRPFLEFAARLKGLPAREISDQVTRAMEFCNLDGWGDVVIERLSRGFRQRVGLAQAILGDPEVLILDEPTVGLDPEQILAVRSLIQELGRTRTVLLSTHVLSEVERLCSRALIVRAGTILADASLDELTRAGKRSLEDAYLRMQRRGACA